MWQRYNGTTKIFEKSTDDGGSWLPLPLDAAIVTQGTFATARIPDLDAAKIISGVFGTARIPDLDAAKIISGAFAKARQHAQTPYKDEANVFSLAGNQFSEILALSKGASFPAVQVASANANTLDDYEEGAFVPIFTSSGGGAPTYTTQSGTYVKIGQMVYVGGRITMATKATLAAGNLRLEGLPFTLANLGNSMGGASIGFFGGITSNAVSVLAFWESNSTRMHIYWLGAAGASANPLTVADVNGTVDFIFGGVYRANG